MASLIMWSKNPTLPLWYVRHFRCIHNVDTDRRKLVKSLSVRNIQRQEGTIFVTFQALEAHEVKPGVIWMSSNRWHCIDCGASSNETVRTRRGNGLKILLIIVPDRETGTFLLSYISLDDQESTQELGAGKTGDYY
jgi:hypothetical protein